MTVELRILRLPHALDLALPEPQTEHSAGIDLRAAVATDTVIEPMQIVLIPCGIAVEIPRGFEGQVRPRSGLSSKHGITLVNCVGTIDADYRGEVSVPLINLGAAAFVVTRGMRLAQMLITPVPQLRVVEVQSLESTSRGAGGFGHTGTH